MAKKPEIDAEELYELHVKISAVNNRVRHTVMHSRMVLADLKAAMQELLDAFEPHRELAISAGKPKRPNTRAPLFERTQAEAAKNSQ